MTSPIVKSVTVPVSPDRAFARFTSDIMGWWPLGRHSVSAGQGKLPKEVVIEPQVGGAVYEIMYDGDRVEWGEITDWNVPNGFTMTWHPGSGAENATQLALAFEPSDVGTKVTLTHSGWDVLADRAEESRSHYSSGWDHVLGDCYAGRL